MPRARPRRGLCSGLHGTRSACCLGVPRGRSARGQSVDEINFTRSQSSDLRSSEINFTGPIRPGGTRALAAGEGNIACGAGSVRVCASRGPGEQPPRPYSTGTPLMLLPGTFGSSGLSREERILTPSRRLSATPRWSTPTLTLGLIPAASDIFSSETRATKASKGQDEWWEEQSQRRLGGGRNAESDQGASGIRPA
jgi:hypothetical protein